MSERLFWDQALRDVTNISKINIWDSARVVGELLHHVVNHPGGDPQTCTICAKAAVYARVLEGGLQMADEEG